MVLPRDRYGQQIVVGVVRIRRGPAQRIGYAERLAVRSATVTTVPPSGLVTVVVFVAVL